MTGLDQLNDIIAELREQIGDLSDRVWRLENKVEIPDE